jgi:hypothetical protein
VLHSNEPPNSGKLGAANGGPLEQSAIAMKASKTNALADSSVKP